MNEEWSTISEYPDYEVSDLGRVRRIDSGRILKPSKHHLGPFRVNLYKNGVYKGHFIHRLVAAHFLPDYKENREVLFKDNNSEHYYADNLRVGSRKRSGLPKDLRVQIIETGEIFPSATAAARHIDGQAGNVLRVLYGSLLTHKGYTFRYVKV